MSASERIDLSVDLCGVRLANPLVLASGIWGSSAKTLVRAGREGAGAVTAKSISLEARSGHPNPTVLDWGAGLINAVGLSNPGAEAGVRMLAECRQGLAPLGVPLIASVFANTTGDFRAVAKAISSAEPDLLELNISCPNVEAEFGRPFALESGSAAQVTGAVREVYKGAMLVKLSPNALDIAGVARAVADAGADGITAVNTLGPGMVIDVRARRPILSNRVGGVSGPALRPIALRCVHQIAGAVDIPIVGTGGVSSGEDAMAMLMAGATAVGVGSALQGEGASALSRISAELAELMREEGYATLDEFRGCAHG